jgi:hypothetical protein
MKQLLQTKIGTAILAVVAGLVVAVVAWNLGGDWWEVRGTIRNIAGGRDVAKSRTKLEKLNDRGYVLQKLEEAVNDDAYGVRGKFELLATLNLLSQPRAARRALDGSSPSAQRAACWQLYGEADCKARCSEIALAWLQDEKAADRSIAAMICRQLGVEEAQAALLAIVQRDPKTRDELNLFRQAIVAIKDPKPPGLVERLLAMAENPAMDADARGAALEVLQVTKDGPRDRVLDLSVKTLADPGADPIFRKRAALGLRAFPEDRAWQALEAVVLSETEKDRVLQRQCLQTLAGMTPSDAAVADRYLDRLTQLFLDRRVYHSPYFATRVDVATALCAMNVREPIVIDIMCDYLVYEDREDKENLVRQQGWLTLWTLTGERLDDIPSPHLFERPPPPFPDRKAARPYFLTRSRWGITPEQNAAVAIAAKDLAWMQKARQVYQSSKSRVVERWRDDAAKAEEAKKLAEERKLKAAQKEAPQAPGPQPAKEEPKEPESPKAGAQLPAKPN